MNRKFSISAQNVALICIFVFLLARLLIGCDRETPPARLQLGDLAPDFAAKDLDGNVVVLSSLKEGPVVLRFFESNCRFCKADTPAFSEFYKKHQNKGLKILYIGSFYESDKSLRAFAEELGTIFPVILDNAAKLADQYGIRAYPQTLFLSPDHKIVAALLGGVGEAELSEILGKYL
ncbi:MAG: TlpA family protein disulfide reductase [Proteobacteria bacterium]|nr:TlpA family protein disulfide reductase [Pseudomonadota bacterium]